MSRSTTIIKSKYPKEETLKKIDDFFLSKSYKLKKRKSEVRKELREFIVKFAAIDTQIEGYNPKEIMFIPSDYDKIRE